jgi:hypothetical protein
MDEEILIINNVNNNSQKNQRNSFQLIKNKFKKCCDCYSSTLTSFYICNEFFIFLWYTLFNTYSKNNFYNNFDKECPLLKATSNDLMEHYFYLLILGVFIIFYSLIMSKMPRKLNKIFAFVKMSFHVYFFTINVIYIIIEISALDKKENCGDFKVLIIVWIVFFSILYGMISLCCLMGICGAVYYINKLFIRRQ